MFKQSLPRNISSSLPNPPGYPPDEKSDMSHSSPPAQSSSRLRRRVLVIEDNVLANRALCMLLQHYEYDVQGATTLAQALVLLRSNPDEVLLDLGLPDGRGEDILSQIRRTGQRCRVRIITAMNDATRLSKLKLLRPDALYPKPVNFLELLQDLSRPAA